MEVEECAQEWDDALTARVLSVWGKGLEHMLLEEGMGCCEMLGKHVGHAEMSCYIVWGDGEVVDVGGQ